MIGRLAYWRAAWRVRALARGAEPRGREDVLCAYRVRARDRGRLAGRVATAGAAPPEELARRDVRVLFGAPAPTLAVLDGVERATGRAIRDVWPRWRGFIHEGVDFRPYEPVYRRRVGHGIVFVETYRTPDGRLLAVQDRPRDDSLAVVGDLGLAPPAENVVCELPATGDVARIVSQRPLRLVIERRAGLNAFGERVTPAEMESAVRAAAAAHGCGVRGFAVLPEYPDARSSRGRHVWLLELEAPLPDLHALAAAIDAALQHGNAHYAAARGYLRPPLVRLVRRGTFERRDVPRVVNAEQALRLL